jgi:hypothetical protein
MEGKKKSRMIRHLSVYFSFYFFFLVVVGKVIVLSTGKQMDPWINGRSKVLREIQLVTEPSPVNSVSAAQDPHDLDTEFQPSDNTPVELPHWIRVLTILLDEPGSWTEAVEKTSVSLMRFFLSVFLLCLVIVFVAFLSKRILFRYIHHHLSKKQKKSE